jgi:hypothetical protein
MAQDFSRAGRLQEAVKKIEQKFPHFREPAFCPGANRAEVQAFEEYRALSESLDTENMGIMLRQFVDGARTRDAKSDKALARMGLLPVSESEAFRVAPDEPSGGTKVSRGKFCELVIAQIKFLQSEIPRFRTRFSFASLWQKYPDLQVLEALSRPPFTEEDREYVCCPNPVGDSCGDVRDRSAEAVLLRKFG